MIVDKRTIKCPSCGNDTGIPIGPLLMVIPDEGIKCILCGCVIFQGNSAMLCTTQPELVWQQ